MITKNQDIGKALEAQMYYAKLSVVEFARLHGTSPSFIHRTLKRGVSRNATVEKLAATLGMNADELRAVAPLPHKMRWSKQAEGVENDAV